MSDYDTTIGPISVEDELKVEQTLIKCSKVKQYVVTPKKDITITPTNNKRKIRDLRNNNVDSDTDSPNSSPPSSPPKTRQKQAKTTNKQNISTKNTGKLPSKNTRSTTKVPIISTEEMNSVDSTLNKSMHADISNMISSIKDIKKEIADIKQAIPTSNSTPLSPRQAHNTNASNGFSQVPNASSVPNYTSQHTCTAPQHTCTAPEHTCGLQHTCTVPQHTTAPEHTCGLQHTFAPHEPLQSHSCTYAPSRLAIAAQSHSCTYAPHPQHNYDYCQEPDGYNSPHYYKPSNQLPDQYFIDHMLNDEIYHHLEQARHHSELANNLLHKKAK